MAAPALLSMRGRVDPSPADFERLGEEEVVPDRVSGEQN